MNEQVDLKAAGGRYALVSIRRAFEQRMTMQSRDIYIHHELPRSFDDAKH
jgi:hypothetical protein